MEAVEGYARYAVYWAPAPGSALAREGAAWLGHDPTTGEEDAARAADPRVAEPRRYGLHATLKPPFRLAEGATAGALDAAMAALAGRLRVAEAPGLAVDAALGFLGLRPAGPCPEIDAVAAACVTELDGFRAPLTAEERARRLASGLDDPARIALLDRWGYPYVLDAFRFHVTLTGRLDAATAEATRAEVEARFGPLLAPVFALDRLCLFGDPGAGRPFRLLSHHALTG
jgi:putative phosphonate metabolism protein